MKAGISSDVARQAEYWFSHIIANALWHGKTVLFVSEKMAALKVVRDRLDHMGLGLNCLEVHSAKASKASVLKSIPRTHPPFSEITASITYDM
jgi:hypothetical protein